MLKNILVPLDGSELAERALDHATTILKPHGQITLVYVLDEINEPFNRYTVTDMQLMRENIEENAAAYLEKVGDRLRDEAFTTKRRVEYGNPADRIVQVAAEDNVDVIVMSTRGRSGFSRWIMGSVTQKVLTAARCPVFVIPPKG